MPDLDDIRTRREARVARARRAAQRGRHAAARRRQRIPPPRGRLGRRHADRARRLRRTGILALALVLIVLGGWAVTREGARAPAGAEAASGAGAAAVKHDPRGSSTPPATARRATSPAARRTTPDDLPRAGTGRLRFLPLVAVPRADRGPVPAGARRVTFTVEAEGGTGADVDAFAREVPRILVSRRGWQTEIGVRFVQVSRPQAARTAPDIRITLASPRTTDRLCRPAQTRGQVSCFNRGRAVINAVRWETGAQTYHGRRGLYRVYVINHEVGHGLGLGHEHCRSGRAPVMLQQTLRLGGCRAWPYPSGDGSIQY